MKRALSVGCCLLLGACGAPGSSNTSTIVIGAIIDRTGSEAAPSWADAVNMAVTDANAALEAAHKGYRFQLLLRDSANDSATTVTAATDLVKNKNAKAIITDGTEGDTGVNSLNYDPDSSKHLNVPIICMACTATAINNPMATDSDPVLQQALRNGEGWNFRTTGDTSLEAIVAARVLGAYGDTNGDGKVKVSVEAADATYPRGLVDGFATALPHDVGSLTAKVDEWFHPDGADVNTYDWAGDMTKLLGSADPMGAMDGKPDALMDVTDPSYSVALMQAYVAANPNPPPRFFHTHNFRSIQLLVALGSKLNGQEGVSHAVTYGASGKLFADELKALTSLDPVYRDSMVYDAGFLFMLAIAQAVKTSNLTDATAVTGVQIRDALKTLNASGGTSITPGTSGFTAALTAIDGSKSVNYDGASGPCDFDANGNVIQAISHWKVMGSAFTDIETYDCVTDSMNCPKQ